MFAFGQELWFLIDEIALKFIWHMTSNKTQSSKREVTCQFGQEYLSLAHDVLVLFMFFLMADLAWVEGGGSKLCYR